MRAQLYKALLEKQKADQPLFTGMPSYEQILEELRHAKETMSEPRGHDLPEG
jgi:hypothetical protein